MASFSSSSTPASSSSAPAAADTAAAHASAHAAAAVLPGIIAGVVETLAVQPLDMVKTRFQIREGVNPSLLRGIMEVAREGGVLRFYRGLLPSMASMAPARTAMYTSYAAAHRFLEKALTGDPEGHMLPGVCALAAGGFAGVPEAVVATPLQLVKVRLQAKAHVGRYRNAFHCVYCILRTEGPGALFLGLRTTAYRNAIYNSVYFWAQGRLRIGEKEASPAVTAGCAFLAGALATCFNAPFDFAKSRIQQQVVGVEPKYKSTFQTLALTWREEGPRAIYKGFVPKVCLMATGGAVGMVVFETMHRFLLEA